jgi:hypothetical protein
LTVAKITRAHLENLVDFEDDANLIRHALREALHARDSRALVRFFARYASWNGFFGAGVATLAGKIGRARGLFMDWREPLQAAADRSVLVASYFFDAARDEFDDHETAERDPHRCLAQAFLKGLASLCLPQMNAGEQNALMADPLWLTALNNSVAGGYGAYRPDDLPTLFAAMGYHLGSEVLADREFSIIDEALSAEGDLVTRLKALTVPIGPQQHNAYVWVQIHSGSGGAAEADHFAWATQGVNLALDYVDESLQSDLIRQVERGFISFANDQREFFAFANR